MIYCGVQHCAVFLSMSNAGEYMSGYICPVCWSTRNYCPCDKNSRMENFHAYFDLGEPPKWTTEKDAYYCMAQRNKFQVCRKCPTLRGSCEIPQSTEPCKCDDIEVFNPQGKKTNHVQCA